VKNILQINYWTIGGFEGGKPAEQALEEAKGMGYEGVELCFGAGEFAPGISFDRLKQIRKRADDLGMKIETLASGTYWDANFTSPDPAVRARAREFTGDYLRAAAQLGAKTVLVIPGAVAVPWDPSKPVVSYASAWKRATEGIRKCLRDAEKFRVNIAIENVWNWFLADPVAMKVFVDQFKSARVGVYMDVANCLINGFPEHWIEILGHRIKAVHFKNFSRQDSGGTLHGFGDDVLGGDLNWAGVLAALEKIGYRGPITAEMIPFSRLPNLVLPDMGLARDAAEKLRRILGK